MKILGKDGDIMRNYIEPSGSDCVVYDHETKVVIVTVDVMLCARLLLESYQCVSTESRIGPKLYYLDQHQILLRLMYL